LQQAVDLDRKPVGPAFVTIIRRTKKLVEMAGIDSLKREVPAVFIQPPSLYGYVFLCPLERP